MNQNNSILSDITVFNKYAKYDPTIERRETWEEICNRNIEMHIKKIQERVKEVPKAMDLIDTVRYLYKHFVIPKKVLPSMRSMQFAGKPIELNPSRVYNCAYLPVDDYRAFSETMFLLLGGTGVGYSVQKHHIEKLPDVVGPNKNRNRRYLIGDSIEGWADSIKILMKSYMEGKSTVVFDFSDIRAKGEQLVTSGGKAPGPEPLEQCLLKIKYILENSIGRQLSSLECHDIQCHIADAVLAGGIRRAAMISLFSANDEEMLTCKAGNWWETNGQRGRANNSAVLVRHRLTEKVFKDLWKKTELSNAGEPGVYLTNDAEWGTNPCCEIALRPFQFCNLTEINAATIEDQQDFEDRCTTAAILGTLQASYTDFHYLRPVWQRTTEKDALLGVSMTGIASGTLEKLDLETGVGFIRRTNFNWSRDLGINKAARLTCVKPAGTTSLVLGTSSGIHAWHNDYYIRRMRLLKSEALYSYLLTKIPDLIEDDVTRSHDTAVLSIPIKAPDGATFRTESPIDLLNRDKWISDQWVKPGHINGNNTHNVSATISIKDGEWEEVVEWMWQNRKFYNGLSVLPYFGGSYAQTPFEDCTKEEYEELSQLLDDIDLTQVYEVGDETNLKEQIACSGASCEII